jgi:hypothetical protein
MRVADGLRDLRNAYVRANTCVACHQNVDPELLRAGHPELTFELDGQVVTQPRHWLEATNWSTARAWLVGQAVALREMSWHESETKPGPRETDRQVALHWLLKKVANGPDPQSALLTLPVESSAENLARIKEVSDRLARHVADAAWPADRTRTLLQILAGTAGDFRDATVSKGIQARRAERLVLGLDRLWAALDYKGLPPTGESDLHALFGMVQSLPDFDPAAFANRLSQFAHSLE